MSKRELIVRELDHVAEQDLDKLIAFLQTLKDVRPPAAIRTPAAESSLAKGLADSRGGRGLGQFVSGDVVVLNRRSI